VENLLQIVWLHGFEKRKHRMGIRITKVLGYGVRNLKTRKKGKSGYPEACDPRVDTEKLQHLLYQTGDHYMPEFVSWMKDHKEEILSLHAREWVGTVMSSGGHDDFDFRMNVDSLSQAKCEKMSVSACITHQEEYGLPKVLVFRPPEFPEWDRHDNMLDWIEAKGVPCNHSREIKRAGLWPYDSGMIRFRKPSQSFSKQKSLGNRCDEWGPVHLNPSEYSQMVGWWDPKRSPLAEGDFLEHLKKDFRPRVPMTVIALVLWTGAFPDPAAFIDDLRPVLYVYWN
jgi:hypothetical protein